MNDFWQGRSVLITGITGFVGSSIAQRLLNEGAEVTGIVKDVRGDERGFMHRCNIALGNITDYDLLRSTISRYEVDTIFHLAANAIVRVAAQDPFSAYDVNVMGTVALLEAARNVGKCRSIVVASSDKAYGDHADLPYRETLALQPKNTYDTSKACMDMVARSYAQNYRMPVCVTRCSNIYGPGDRNFSRIIPNTVAKILDGKKPVLYRSIERMEREFIYIDDVVDAFVRLALAGGTVAGEAFNVGGTGPVKIRDLVEKIAALMGKPDIGVEIKDRDEVFKEIERQYIDATKIKECVGWEPMTSLDVGLSKTVDYYWSELR